MSLQYESDTEAFPLLPLPDTTWEKKPNQARKKAKLNKKKPNNRIPGDRNIFTSRGTFWKNIFTLLQLHSTGTDPNLRLPHFPQCFLQNLWNRHTHCQLKTFLAFLVMPESSCSTCFLAFSHGTCSLPTLCTPEPSGSSCANHRIGLLTNELLTGLKSNKQNRKFLYANRNLLKGHRNSVMYIARELEGTGTGSVRTRARVPVPVLTDCKLVSELGR